MPRSLTQTLSAFALLLIVTLACIQQLVQHPTDILVGSQRGGVNDLTDQFIAWRSFPRNVLRNAESRAAPDQTSQAESARNDNGATHPDSIGERFPFWNPYGLCGIPWLANPQSALFYPLNWVFLLTDAPWLVGWMLVFHHWLAGAGTYLLCRRYGRAWCSSLVGGVVFLAAPFLLAQTGEGHFNQICVIAWVPWAFLVFERLRQGQAGGVALQSLTLALCFFAGHVQELYYLVLILSTFVALDVLKSFGPRGNAGTGMKLLGRWIAAGISTAGLVAVELMPIRFYTQFAARAGGMKLQDSAAGGLSLEHLKQLLDPFALGGPDSTGAGAIHEVFWETLTHFGILPLALACFGSLFSGRRYPVARMRGLLMLSLLFAMGTHGPLFGLMHKFVPGIALFRIPARALYFSSLAIAVLAAAGTEVLTVGKRLCRLRQLIAVALLAGCTCELTLFADKILRTVPTESFRSHNPIVEFLTQTSLFSGESRGEGEQQATSPHPSPLPEGEGSISRKFSRVVVQQDLLSDREAWAYGIFKIHGYDPVPLMNYARVLDALTKQRDPALESGGFHTIDIRDYHPAVVDLLGIRYAVLQLNDAPEEWQGWRRVATGEVVQEVALRGSIPRSLPYAIYENPRALPRAFVLGSTREVKTDTDAIEMLPRIDPRQELLITRDVHPTGPRQEFAPANVTHYTPNRIEIDATLDAAGYLVLADVWYPGWKATVNGKSADVVPANIGLRAIPLTAGKHHVTLNYTPPGLLPGLVVSIVTIICLAMTLIASRAPVQQDAPQPSGNV